MINRHGLVALAFLFFTTMVVSSSVAAIDLSYNPDFDAPSSNKSDTDIKNTRQLAVTKRLPGERELSGVIGADPHPLNDKKQDQETRPVGGWAFKTPSLSSDKEPDIKDERQSVKMSEQQLWQEGGKNYDDNPLNRDNYRVNVEAEYTF